MSKERSLDWYKEAIRNGQRFQIKHAHSKMWPQYKAYYRHNFPGKILPVNLVFSILRSTVPQVYFRNPSVTVSATKPGLEFELHARLIEDIDNWLLRELNTKYQMKRLITDGFLCGIGNIFTGYDSQYGFDKKLTVGKSGVASLTQFDKSGDKIEHNEGVVPGMPWGLRARPEDTIYPWGTESVESAEFVALRLFRPLANMQADAKYKNTKDLAGSFEQRRTSPEGGTRSEYDASSLKDHKWVELWQVHDAKTKEIVGLTMDHDKFIRKEEDLTQVDGLPVLTSIFNPDPDYIYGIPDARIIEPQLLELNEIRTQAMHHRRIDILKFLYKKGAMKPIQLEKLLNEKVQAGIEVEADLNLKDVVMPLNPGASAILADLDRMGEVIRGDVREAVGFSRSSTGEYQGKTHISAKETDVVNWANQIRVDERRDIMADILSRIVRKFNQFIFTYWTQPMVRSVVGPDGARYWIKFKPSDIKAEYNYKIDPTNAVPVDQRTKRADAIEMAKAWAAMNQGLVASGAPAPSEIQRYFFNQFDGINVDRLMAELQQSGQQGQAGGPGQSQGQPMSPRQAAGQVAQRRQ